MSRARWTTALFLGTSLACAGAIPPGPTAAAPPPAPQTCGSFRDFLPDDMPCTSITPASQGAFEESRGDDRFGIAIEMAVLRNTPTFRPVPLSTPVCSGDSVAFELTPSEPGYIHVLNHGTSGRWTHIFPGPGEDGAFSPDAVARLPSRSDDGFPVTGPAGEEHLMFFVSPGPFSKGLIEQMERVTGLAPPPTGDGGGTRAIVLQTRDLGRATEAYVVGHGEQVVAFPLIHHEVCGPLP